MFFNCRCEDVIWNEDVILCGRNEKKITKTKKEENQVLKER